MIIQVILCNRDPILSSPPATETHSDRFTWKPLISTCRGIDNIPVWRVPLRWMARNGPSKNDNHSWLGVVAYMSVIMIVTGISYGYGRKSIQEPYGCALVQARLGLSNVVAETPKEEWFCLINPSQTNSIIKHHALAILNHHEHHQVQIFTVNDSNIWLTAPRH